MTIKKGDFIELDYTGKTKEELKIFDTTILSIAEDAGLIHKHEPGHDHDHSDQFSSIVICVGEKHVLPALDEALVGSTIGEHQVVLGANSAFGKKDAKLITTFPMTFFKQQKIQPYIGLQLNFDNNRIGIVRSVGAGRVMVDFNHPLAGRDIVYDVKIKRVVTDETEKLQGLLKVLRFPFKSAEVKDKKAFISYDLEIPDKYLDMLKEDIKRILNVDVELINNKKPEKNEEKELVKNEYKNVDKNVDKNEENYEDKKASKKSKVAKKQEPIEQKEQ